MQVQKHLSRNRQFLRVLLLIMAFIGITVIIARDLTAKKSSLSQNSIIIPDGTALEIRMIDQLDTGRTKVGAPFNASLSKDLTVGGRQIAARDSLVYGSVTDVVSSGRLKRPASITLKLHDITLSNGRKTRIQTSPHTLDGKSHALRNAALIGGGAAAGAVLGGVAGGKKGALIGSGVGAGAGLTTAYLTGKQEIVIPPETNFSFTTIGNSNHIGGGDAASNQWANSAFSKDKAAPGSIGRIVFSERDRSIIRDYFGGRYSNLPPGLAKRGGNLPPGLEKQLRRNGKLPPGLQKRVEPFPQDLEIRLPRLPDRIGRIILGRRAMIVDEQQNILDIIDDIMN